MIIADILSMHCTAQMAHECFSVTPNLISHWFCSMFLHERAIFHRLFAILGRGHILLKFLIYVSGKVITLLRFQALPMIFEMCTVHILKNRRHS